MNPLVQALKPAYRSKYRNRPTFVDGLRFDSMAEARRWTELQILEKAGDIKNLKRQAPFACVVNGEHVCKYIADFTYEKNSRFIAEDVKGVETALFKLKAALLHACHGLDVEIVKVRR